MQGSEPAVRDFDFLKVQAEDDKVCRKVAWSKDVCAHRLPTMLSPYAYQRKRHANNAGNMYDVKQNPQPLSPLSATHHSPSASKYPETLLPLL